MNKLLLVGGGGHCKAIIDIAESTGREIAGILDVREKVGESVLGYPVIAADGAIEEWADKVQFLVTVGYIKDPSLRIRLHNRIVAAGGKFATLIAPTAYVSKHAEVGVGSVIMHHAMVNAEAKVGSGCIINTFANIEHDTVVGDFTHISTGAMVNGNCTIGKGVFIGSRSVIVNGTSICDGSIIGAGTLIRKNILTKGVYYGDPTLLKKTI